MNWDFINFHWSIFNTALEYMYYNTFRSWRPCLGELYMFTSTLFSRSGSKMCLIWFENSHLFYLLMLFFHWFNKFWISWLNGWQIHWFNYWLTGIFLISGSGTGYNFYHISYPKWPKFPNEFLGHTLSQDLPQFKRTSRANHQ